MKVEVNNFFGRGHIYSLSFKNSSLSRSIQVSKRGDNFTFLCIIYPWGTMTVAFPLARLLIAKSMWWRPWGHSVRCQGQEAGAGTEVDESMREGVGPRSPGARGMLPLLERHAWGIISFWVCLEESRLPKATGGSGPGDPHKPQLAADSKSQRLLSRPDKNARPGPFLTQLHRDVNNQARPEVPGRKSLRIQLWQGRNLLP